MVPFWESAVEHFRRFQFDEKLWVIDWNAVTALSGILIAFVGITIGYIVRRRQKLNEAFVVLSDYRKQVFGLSTTFINATADALLLIDGEPGKTLDPKELRELSERFSSIIDIARFIFPNDIGAANSFGRHKGPAFEGRRTPPLDAIMAAYYAIRLVEANRFDSHMWVFMANEELSKTNQPISQHHNPTDPRSLIIQARRSYLNATVPHAFSRKWRKMVLRLIK